MINLFLMMKEDLLRHGNEVDLNNKENKERNMQNNSNKLIGKDMMILGK
jgi:hypothetical protein